MSESNSSGLSQELLDDFFTEADEHLLNMRRTLLGLENSENEAGDPQLIGALFHDFHSFKGISAIVGLEPAEALAHVAEDLLRLMRNGEVRSRAQAVNLLNAVSHKLEQMVAAFRRQKTLPEHESLLGEIKNLSSELQDSEPSLPPDEAAPPTPASQVDPGQPAGKKVWKFTFSPSQELTAQKINITAIREQLSQVGEILKATPVVKGRGIIVFEFLIASGQAPPDVREWAAKGVTCALAGEPESPAAPVLAAAPPSSGESTHSPFLAPSHLVRVDLKRLDDLLRLVGEMVIHRSKLDIQLAQLNAQGGNVDLRGVQEVNRMLGRSLRQMREDIMRIRLVPMSEIFARLPFVVRDLSRQTSKQVRLKLTGQETAIDKYLIEKLKDPLLHMVRNAFSHGIETTAERAAAGKPEEATIELSALALGDVVIIKVKDDGKGIDARAILERARKLGLKVPLTAEQDALLNILCSPGFSSRDDADRTSGRGVGMAVVQAAINELGGKLTLESEVGKGTQFTLRLPLSVVIAETLLVASAGQTCAVPQSSVREIFHASEDDITIADGIEMVAYRGGVLPVTRLAGLFHLKGNDLRLRCILVVTSERGSIGLLVEKVLGQREVVVRPFRDPLIQVAGISGATELGDGKPVLILDGVALTAGKVRPPESLNFAQK